MKKGKIECIRLLGVPIHLFTIDQLHETISHLMADNAHAIVANVNVNAMNIAYEQPWFKQFLNAAEYVFCDGHGVMLGARVQGKCIPQKITYAHWFPLFCEFCAAQGFSLFLLGGVPGVAEKARTKLVHACPALNIAGVHHGFFNKERQSEENQSVIRAINESGARILLTSFGMPLQEKWLSENWPLIQANIALTGGAALDYMAGVSRRPPAFFTATGFEWLGRLLYEPGRLWKRYLLGNPVFLIRVIMDACRHKRLP
ncbi:MAG: glycosyltransferase [Spartobacteria bacterium]|nr:glycosyltransferase [Spartobacteria bacterium]